MKSSKEELQITKSVNVESQEDSSKNKHFERKPNKIKQVSFTRRTPKNSQLQQKFQTYYLPQNKDLKINNLINGSNKKVQKISNNQKYLYTQRTNNYFKKNVNNSIRSNKDSAQFYKYWKAKANQYQQANFTLIRVNSALKQENQILKHRYKKLQKQIQKKKQDDFGTTQPYQGFSKIQKFYKYQIQQDKKIINQQKFLITRQEKKIKQLSKYISQNYQLKNILENLQDRANVISNKANSRVNSAGKNYENPLECNNFSPNTSLHKQRKTMFQYQRPQRGIKKDTQNEKKILLQNQIDSKLD